jgi:glycosyltransferase involved in cell wall biosynthesis
MKADTMQNNEKMLSILTPILANKGTTDLLPETVTSVKQQDLPLGWSLEWIIMEDGDRPVLENYPWPDSVRYQKIEKRVGEPSARTLALSTAIGEVVLAFDADDTLPPDSLKKICTAFDENPDAKWVAGQESTPRHPTPWIDRYNTKDYIEEGYCHPGTIYPFWKRTGQFPVTFQCSYKAETLWRFGGYPAMPYGGDINLLFAVSSVEPGVVLHDTLLNYRRWPGQMTAQKEYFAVKDMAQQHAEKWIQAITRKKVS